VKIHIVQKGDTLWKIAKKYGVNFEELKKLNSQLSNPDMIMPGMKIKVPTAGGNIKKETQTGTGGAKINMGSKKEQPIKEHSIVKEKPIKEVPVKEVPVKEVPIEMPVKEKPVEKPKEKPKKPFIPKIPQPIIPDIDINNYYMTNMSNINVHEQPNVPPPLPPKPENILPIIPPSIPKELPKKELPIKEVPKKEAPVKSLPKQTLPKKEAPVKSLPKQMLPKKEAPAKALPKQEWSNTKPLGKPLQKQQLPVQKAPTGIGGQYQPMFSYPQQLSPIYQQPYPPSYDPCYDPCYPGPQAMPYPNMYAQGPYPEVQGAYQQAQPLPYPGMPGANIPVQPQGFPEVQGAYQQAQHLPYPEMHNGNIPVQPQGFPEVQGSYMPQEPSGFSSAEGYHWPTNIMPGVPNEEMFEESSPFMGSEPMVAGVQTPPQPFYGAPVNPSFPQNEQFVNPQVQGQSMGAPQPMMPGPVMPAQMPMMGGVPMGYPPYPAQNEKDCGCGGPKASPYGSQPSFQHPSTLPSYPYRVYGGIPPYPGPYGYTPVPPYPDQFGYGQEAQFHPFRSQEFPDYGSPYDDYEGHDQRDELDESYE
jgi:morphogenetic protein associated with SpoVID